MVYIKSLRKSNKMTQNALAKRIGVSQKTVSAYENGSIVPSVRVFFELSNLFNVDMKSLVEPYLEYTPQPPTRSDETNNDTMKHTSFQK